MHKNTIILREKILNQSFLMFVEKGYNFTTTREIASACEIERGVLHYHFNRKQDILFEFYRRFYSLLFDSIADKFPDEKNVVHIIASDILLYRLLMTRDGLSRMLVDIISNRDLTKEKITETSKVLDRVALGISYEKIRLALSIAIGAEVELILQKIDGEIDISLDELAKWVSWLVLSVLGFSQADYEKYYQRAIKCADQFDERAFANIMEENTSWFDRALIK